MVLSQYSSKAKNMTDTRYLRRLLIPLAVCLGLLSAGMQQRFLRTDTTTNFRVRYPRTVPARKLVRIEKMLERAFTDYRERLNVSPAGKISVVFTTSAMVKSETNVYDDAAFHDERIVLDPDSVLAPDSLSRRNIDRVVARALLNSLPSCPPWLAETYSIWAGRDFSLFGKPARLTETGFSDLHEDFARAERPEELRDMYAKISATAQFFIERYGEKKFEGVLTEMRRGKSLEDAFKNSFGEDMPAVERAWVQYLQQAAKG